MRGGDLHWIWSPYSLYQDIDYVRALATADLTLFLHLSRSTVYGHSRVVKVSLMLNVS